VPHAQTEPRQIAVAKQPQREPSVNGVATLLPIIWRQQRQALAVAPELG